MATTKASQWRYPPELRERGIRMMQETIAQAGGERYGVVTRVAKQLGIGPETLRLWVTQAEVDAGHGTDLASCELGAVRSRACCLRARSA